MAPASSAGSRFSRALGTRSGLRGGENKYGNGPAHQAAELERMAGALPAFLIPACAPRECARQTGKAAGTRPALPGRSSAHLPPLRAQQGARAQAKAQPASVGTANHMLEEVNHELWIHGIRV